MQFLYLSILDNSQLLEFDFCVDSKLSTSLSAELLSSSPFLLVNQVLSSQAIICFMFFEFSVRFGLLWSDTLIIRLNLYEYLTDAFPVRTHNLNPDVGIVLHPLPVNRVLPVEITLHTVLLICYRIKILDSNRFCSPTENAVTTVAVVVEMILPTAAEYTLLRKTLLRMSSRDVVPLSEFLLFCLALRLMCVLIFLVKFWHLIN